MRRGHGYSFGWFSTGRDEAACGLLRAAQEATNSDFIPASIEYVFVNREPGEAQATDSFFHLAAELGIPRVTLSSRRFEPELRRRSLSEWRRRFDQEIVRRLADYQVDAVVLAGYMLIVSPELCQRYTLVNLHPALPGGPTGSWEQVIDTLIEERATESGVQVHRVTADLDRGPALSSCRFPIPASADRETLRTLIRGLQIEREIPLLLLTLRAMALEERGIYKDRIVDRDGNEVPPLDLTERVAAMLEKSTAYKSLQNGVL